MSITTTKTSSSGYKQNGVSRRHVRTSTNGKTGTSYDSTRSTVYSAGNKHVVTTRAYASAPKPMKSTPMPKLKAPKALKVKALPKPKASRMHKSPSFKAPSFPKSRSSSRSTRSSSGDAGGALALLLLIGLFTGLWFAIKSLYSWATTSKDVTVTPESAPAIEANADPLLLK